MATVENMTTYTNVIAHMALARSRINLARGQAERELAENELGHLRAMAAELARDLDLA